VTGRPPAPRRGFTLLEVMLAVSLLALVSAVTYMTFAAVLTGWRRGVSLAENLHHGDFVLEQLAMGLRSTYYPDAGGKATLYGFWLEDNGEGQGESDVVSWVKLGGALVGQDSPFAGAPHRVKFFVDDDEDGARAAFIKAWRIDGQPEDFDPDEDVEPVLLSRRVSGFNCRTLMPEDVEDDGAFEWQDEWEYTNDLPIAVEITLYVAPPEGGTDPVAVKRIVQIPVAFLCEPWEKTGDSEVAP
jgi:prepilin-type N-terminal cleavage/methylation domain-containing protein